MKLSWEKYIHRLTGEQLIVWASLTQLWTNPARPEKQIMHHAHILIYIYTNIYGKRKAHTLSFSKDLTGSTMLRASTVPEATAGSSCGNKKKPTWQATQAIHATTCSEEASRGFWKTSSRSAPSIQTKHARCDAECRLFPPFATNLLLDKNTLLSPS